MTEWDETWMIIDRRSGKQWGFNIYPSFEVAGKQIDAWQDRHERGGRPEITREMLLNMVPKKVASDD